MHSVKCGTGYISSCFTSCDHLHWMETQWVIWKDEADEREEGVESGRALQHDKGWSLDAHLSPHTNDHPVPPALLSHRLCLWWTVWCHLSGYLIRHS